MEHHFSQHIWHTEIVAVRTQFDHYVSFPSTQCTTSHTMLTTPCFAVSSNFRHSPELRSSCTLSVTICAYVRHLQEITCSTEAYTTLLRLPVLCRLSFRLWNMPYQSIPTTLLKQDMQLMFSLITSVRLGLQSIGNFYMRKGFLSCVPFNSISTAIYDPVYP